MKELRVHTSDNTQNIVIFVHGFGVRWDSRGMFTELASILPQEWGSVLFDFYEVNDDHVYITDMNEQMRRLKTIINDVQVKYTNSKIHIISHSVGCIVSALVKPEIDGEVIFLAPPENFGSRIQTYFENYPGVKKTEEDLIVPRRDGTLTHIPYGYFEQLKEIHPELCIEEYSHAHKISLLQTTQDEVIGKTTYSKLQESPNITITQIASDHNFTEESRPLLVNYIKSAMLSANKANK